MRYIFVVILSFFFVRTSAQQYLEKHYNIYAAINQLSKNVMNKNKITESFSSIKGKIRLVKIDANSDLFYLCFKHIQPAEPQIDSIKFYKKNAYLFKGIWYKQSAMGEVTHVYYDTAINITQNLFYHILNYISYPKNKHSLIQKIDGLYSISINQNFEKGVKKYIPLEVSKIEPISEGLIKKHYSFIIDGFYKINEDELINSVSVFVEKRTKLNHKTIVVRKDTFLMQEDTSTHLKPNNLPALDSTKLVSVKQIAEIIQQKLEYMADKQKGFYNIDSCIYYLKNDIYLINKYQRLRLASSVQFHMKYHLDSCSEIIKTFYSDKYGADAFEVIKTALIAVKSKRTMDIISDYLNKPDLSENRLNEFIPNISFLNCPSKVIFDKLFSFLTNTNYSNTTKESLLLTISNLTGENKKCDASQHNKNFNTLRTWLDEKGHSIDSLLLISIYGNTASIYNLDLYKQLSNNPDTVLQSATIYSLRYLPIDTIRPILQNIITTSLNSNLVKKVTDVLVLHQPDVTLINTIYNTIHNRNKFSEIDEMLVKIIYNWTYQSREALACINNLYNVIKDPLFKQFLGGFLDKLKDE
jgi:hypothetical protein